MTYKAAQDKIHKTSSVHAYYPLEVIKGQQWTLLTHGDRITGMHYVVLQLFRFAGSEKA
jgi:hypothetical protein